MADLPVQGVQDYGKLLSSYGEGLAAQTNAISNDRNSRVNAAMLPYDQATAKAGVAKTQTETQGLDIGNQSAAMKLTALKTYLDSLKQGSDATGSGVNPGGDNEKGETNPLTGLASDNPSGPGGATSGGGGQQTGTTDDPAFHDDSVASDKMDTQMGGKYKVNRAFTPQEQNRFNAATGLAAVTGDNAVVENAQKAHDNRVFNDTASSQKEAQTHFDSAYTVATAPDDRAYTTMQHIDPKFAAHAAQVHGADPDHPEKWTPEQSKAIDSDIRKFATMANEKLTQYTGDTLEGKEGALRNSRTSLPPIGGTRQGLTPQQRATFASEGLKTSAFPDGHGGTYNEHQYKQEGFDNLDQFITARAQAAVGGATTGAANATKTSTGKPTPPGPGSPGQPGSPSANATNQSPSVQNHANTGPVQGRDPNQPAIIRNETDATLRDGLKAASVPQEKGGYGVSSELRGNGPGTTLPANLQERQKATEGARTQLLADSGQAISASGQALQYMNAAKTLLDHPETLQTGPMAKIVSQLSALFPGQHIDATNYQEVAKYLANAAIQQGNTNFTRGLTDKSSDLQTHTLSPNADMTSPAVRNLLEGNIRNTQFSLDSANRVKKFLAAGGDPQLFPDWNQSTFNRSKTVNGPEGKPEAPAIKPGAVANPKNQKDYDALPKGAHYMYNGKEKVKS